MSNEDDGNVSPVWLSMDNLLISKNETNEVRSIHNHSRRKSPTLNDLLNSSPIKQLKQDEYSTNALKKERALQLTNSLQVEKNKKLVNNREILQRRKLSTSQQPRRRVKQDMSYTTRMKNGRSVTNKRTVRRVKKKKPVATPTMVKRAKSKLLAASQRGTSYDLKRLFSNADRDKDKALSFTEWETCLSKHRSSVQFSVQDLQCLFDYVNISKSGLITWDEFIKFVYPKKYITTNNKANNKEKSPAAIPIKNNANNNTMMEEQKDKLTLSTLLLTESTVDNEATNNNNNNTTNSPPPPGPPASPPEDNLVKNHHESKLEDELKRLDRRLEKISANNNKKKKNISTASKNTKSVRKNTYNNKSDKRKNTMITRKGSANGLIENPYRFHRKNTLVITKHGKNMYNANGGTVEKKESNNNNDVSSSNLLQSVLALPDDEISTNNDNNFDDLLGRARQLSDKKGNNSESMIVEKKQTSNDDNEESTLNRRQRNLLLLTLSSPTNTTKNNSSKEVFSQQRPPTSSSSIEVIEKLNDGEEEETRISMVNESLGLSNSDKNNQEQEQHTQQLSIVNDANILRENAMVSQVEYFKQQVVQRDKYILELQDEKKVLMDRIADYRLDISKLESTSSHPVGYLPGRAAMMGFTGRKGNVVENIKNVQELEVELARSSSEIEALRAEIKRLHIVEQEFDSKIQFVANDIRRSVYEEMENLRGEVDRLSKLLGQKDKALQQEKVVHRRAVERIRKSQKKVVEVKKLEDNKSRAKYMSGTRPKASSEIIKSKRRQQAPPVSTRPKSQSSYAGKYQQAIKQRQEIENARQRQKSMDRQQATGKLNARKTFKGVMGGLEEILETPGDRELTEGNIADVEEVEEEEEEHTTAQIHDALSRRKKSMEAYEKEREQTQMKTGGGSSDSDVIESRNRPVSKPPAVPKTFKIRKNGKNDDEKPLPTSPPPAVASSDEEEAEQVEDAPPKDNNIISPDRGSTIPPPPVPPLPSISPPNVSLESLSASSGGSETDSSSMGSSSDGESSVSSTDESLPPPPSMAAPRGSSLVAPPPELPPPSLPPQ